MSDASLGPRWGEDAVPDMSRARRDAEWSYASMLGEAVWHRIASRRGIDPKAESYRRAHDEVVALVRDAAFVIERDGFEGLAQYLRLEAAYDGGSDAQGPFVPLSPGDPDPPASIQ